MEKEILKRNIEQVINQPCLSKYPNEIKPNGLSEDGTYIMEMVVDMLVAVITHLNLAILV